MKWQLDTRNTRNRTRGAKRSFHVFVLPFSNAQQVPKTFDFEKVLEKVLMPSFGVHDVHNLSASSYTWGLRLL